MRKITRNEINKTNMVALSYCQCQKILDMFGHDYKIGYNSGLNGWNYDLYRVNGVDIVTGYNMPYANYSNNQLKRALIALENEIRQTKVNKKKRKQWEKKFYDCFE